MERDDPHPPRGPSTDASGMVSVRDRAIGIMTFATVSVFLPGVSIPPELSPSVANADYAVSSFVEAVQTSLERPRPETS